MNRYALIAIAVLLLPVAVGASGADEQRLNAAREHWAAANVDDYRYVYKKYCVCYSGEPPEIVVTVTGGRVTQAFSRNDYSDREVPAGEGRLGLYWTIDNLFDKLAAAYARDVTVEVEYERELGYPLRIFIDDFADFSGEETDLKLTGFEIL